MAKKARPQAKKKAAQKVPDIVSFGEFLKLKGRQKEPLTIYFDEPQWKTLTKGLKPVAGKLPKKGLRLALFTSPATPGGFGTLSSGPNSAFTLTGGGVVLPSGADKPDPEDLSGRVPDPRDEIFEPQFVPCAMDLSTGFRCVVGSCGSGKCRQKAYVEAIGRWRTITITCQCQA